MMHAASHKVKTDVTWMKPLIYGDVYARVKENQTLIQKTDLWERGIAEISDELGTITDFKTVMISLCSIQEGFQPDSLGYSPFVKFMFLKLFSGSHCQNLVNQIFDMISNKRSDLKEFDETFPLLKRSEQYFKNFEQIFTYLSHLNQIKPLLESKIEAASRNRSVSGFKALKEQVENINSKMLSFFCLIKILDQYMSTLMHVSERDDLDDLDDFSSVHIFKRRGSRDVLSFCLDRS